ncbi:hypothetical protein L1987_46170 [Smallanthus sonchifolius]|uniref:Uncharacterized protein n=1 Tax=Smallanthus sonchifolius TaxID=185202 RepID=A0ACB9G005_9ASTR|nr:hypothetical protein L1987_46170 [Smallanthus sonchifolius]
MYFYARMLRHAPSAVALPLHGMLTHEEQYRVYLKYPDKRKVIFSTNLAETSLAIPGIKYVVDSGMVKENRFELGIGMNVLRVCKVSQSSANQRAGFLLLEFITSRSLISLTPPCNASIESALKNLTQLGAVVLEHGVHKLSVVKETTRLLEKYTKARDHVKRKIDDALSHFGANERLQSIKSKWNSTFSEQLFIDDNDDTDAGYNTLINSPPLAGNVADELRLKPQDSVTDEEEIAVENSEVVIVTLVITRRVLKSSISTNWWGDLVMENGYEAENSGKMVLLLDILTLCSDVGDKALVFNQSLPTLDLTEHHISKLPRNGKSQKCWRRGKARTAL